MLSPTSQTARDRQSRSSFPLTLPLYLSITTLLHALTAAFFPPTPSISRPIHSHSVILSYSIFHLNISVLHISPLVHNSSTDQSILLYHFPFTKMEIEIFFFNLQSKLLNCIFLLSSLVFFHSFEIQLEMGKKM